MSKYIILLTITLIFNLVAKGDFCKASKSYLNNYEPKVFSSINNLLAPPGLLTEVVGKKIILQGTLLDQNCKIITDAKIYMWQVDNNGKYPYKALRTDINHKLTVIDKKSTFQGSGTTTTNNLGIFNFVTIYPPSIFKEAPYVNIRVEHNKLGILQTKIYLKDTKLNKQINNLGLYEFTIIMPVINTMIR
jgi:protocatechuate 3,4-dioxygenase beta subunit